MDFDYLFFNKPSLKYGFIFVLQKIIHILDDGISNDFKRNI
jgi:hypothetical protein